MPALKSLSTSRLRADQIYIPNHHVGYYKSLNVMPYIKDGRVGSCF